MLSYDTLLSELQPLEKGLKDAAAAAVRQQKAIQKHAEEGNLTELRKALNSLRTAIEQLQQRTEGIEEAVEGFDLGEYFSSGDFTRQLLDACAEREINVKGEKGSYEMFPYKVRILNDEEHTGEVYIDRKKAPSCRPAYIASLIQKGQSRLYNAAFRESAFMAELAEAYELACLKSGARVGSTQPLTKIYRSMVPMARSRRDYDMQAFAFDLARLYEAGQDAWVDKAGVHYIFGPSREGAGIRVLTSGGVEYYISTLRQLHDGE